MRISGLIHILLTMLCYGAISISYGQPTGGRRKKAGHGVGDSPVFVKNKGKLHGFH